MLWCRGQGLNRRTTVRISRIVLLIAIAALIALFFVFDLQQYFTLDYFRAQRQAIIDFQAENYLLVVVAFFLIYVVAMAFALPAPLC